MLQTPFGPVHSALVLHWTQRFAVVSQTGLPFLQSVAFAPEHSTHAPCFTPAVKQAGAIAFVHAAGVAAPRSPSHFTQVPAALQIGDRVRVVFESEDDGFAYPMFELDPDGGRGADLDGSQDHGQRLFNL